MLVSPKTSLGPNSARSTQTKRSGAREGDTVMQSTATMPGKTSLPVSAEPGVPTGLRYRGGNAVAKDSEREPKYDETSVSTLEDESLASEELVAIPANKATLLGKHYSDDADFTWMANEEPHRSRRLEILEKYPEIKQLYGHEWRTKYMVAATVALQTCLAIYMRDKAWPLFLLVVYVVGATANHSLFLAIHEWSHNLGFKKPIHNQIGSMFANLPIGVPYSASFKPYHMDHHRNQGVDGLDADIPHPVEAAVIQNRALPKALFIFFQLAFYALRPTILNPIKPTKMTAANLAIQASYDGVLLYFFGFNSLLYLFLSSFLCASFHPTAGHFLSEHLEVVEGIETYSYYGLFNYVTYNVGFHNEHHDFPYVPWSRLPEVTKIASEYYDPLPRCECWVGIIWDYVTNPRLGAYSRVKRTKRVSMMEQVNPNDKAGDNTTSSQ